MAIELIPSSFRCDCGHESDFFENTVREMEKMSKSKRVRLGDGEEKEHTIVFYKGKAIEILCPKLGICRITRWE
jgi:adenylate cyclase class IV